MTVPSNRAIARALAGVVVGPNQIIAPGPGHCPRDRSLSVKLDASSPDGFRVHSFAGDDWRECRDHVRERLGITRETQQRPRSEPKRSEPDKPPSTAAVAIWRSSIDPRGTLGEQYFRSRGLELVDDVADNVLRWSASASCMVSLFRDIRTDEPKAITRTFLDRDGRKIDRKFLGPVGGCAIKLDADAEVTTGLFIGEGVETCMAARHLGLKPAWALGSKGAIGAFPVLSGVECLTILAEPDAEKEIDACAMRWHAARREIIINYSRVGKDLNDAIRGEP
jgi:putative DNA primase/helicase